MSASDRIKDVTGLLVGHPVFQRIESLAEMPPVKLTLTFPPASGPFPTARQELDVEPEAIPVCEEVFRARHRSRNILRTLEHINHCITTVDAIDFSDDPYRAASCFEFEVENYYLRLPTVLEQVYALTSVFCGVDFGPAGGSMRRFEEVVSNKEPDLSQLLLQYKASTRSIKATRNTVAHLGEFVDDAYDTIGAFVQFPNGAWIAQEWLQAYRQHFLETCESQLSEMAACLGKVFDKLLVIVLARYKEEPRPDKRRMLRWATVEEEAKARQGVQQRSS
jgi:hypothetical protein